MNKLYGRISELKTGKVMFYPDGLDPIPLIINLVDGKTYLKTIHGDGFAGEIDEVSLKGYIRLYTIHTS